MKIIYYVEHKDQDLKLRVEVNPLMDGYSCEYYEIKDITLINFRKEYILSQYSKLYKELWSLLNNDDYFLETIEQVYMEVKNEAEIDSQYLHLMEAYD